MKKKLIVPVKYFAVLWIIFGFTHWVKTPNTLDARPREKKVAAYMKPSKDSTQWSWKGKIIAGNPPLYYVDITGDCLEDITATSRIFICNGTEVKGLLDLDIPEVSRIK